ncbi:MAG: GcrA family cell cycle regulator [Rhodospirillales bacterium]
MPKDNACGIDDEVVLLSEATRLQCRWIVGHARRGVFVVCGQRVRTGSSFCEQHHALVWRPTTAERKGRGRNGADDG